MATSNLLCAAVVCAVMLANGAVANMAPSYPDPGAIWTAGKQYTILWSDDGKSPSVNSSWKNFKIDFMTGDNSNQVFLTNVASGLDASKTSSYTWTAPHVDPYSAIYFFMFTNVAGGDSAWTTRFGIVAKDGDTLVPEQQKTQPTGESIPWGTGKLLDNASAASSNTTSSSSSAALPLPSSAGTPASSQGSPAAAAATTAATSGAGGATAVEPNAPSTSLNAQHQASQNAAAVFPRPWLAIALAGLCAAVLHPMLYQ